ncbi:hypothetical protein MHU86_17870 [Fragilaria crotonensis]|nr:hypothetical protein MHU86_17870 [Fragilaria crotonensis]
MLTIDPTVPNPMIEPTLRDLAHQAASDAKLNSFANAYAADPTQALRIASTFSKDLPADARLANLCDSGLVNQMAFLMDVPNGSPTLTVLSCPFPTAKGTDAVFAGSSGTRWISLPSNHPYEDVKGQCITVAAMKSLPTLLNMAISTSDPISEDAPAPADGEAVIPPGPDRLGLEISDPDDAPCITLIPKIFPFSGGYSIPKDTIINTTTTEPIKDMTGAPNLDEFYLWFDSIKYGVTNLQNYSIQARDTLFTYANLDSEVFTPETNIVSRFTVIVNFLTPNDPLYRKVTSNVLAAKDKAYMVYGSKLTRRVAFTTPPKHLPERSETAAAITPTSNVEAILIGLTSAITENSSKTMTSTEREQASEAKEHQSFYEILFANIINETNEDGTVTKKFKKAVLDSSFIQVLKANKNSKATRLLQSAIEAVASEMHNLDNRFASASNLQAELFDQPLTAAIRTATWAHQHTVLQPEGIKTHFAFHHLAPARTWTAEYKTRMEGAMRVTQQEQVEESSARTIAKTTDLYHFGKMTSIEDINTTIGNFYCLMNTIVTINEENPPTIWSEIVEFDKIMRTSEGRKWFNVHRNAKELMFNVVQDLTSTVAGFVAIARRPGYHEALSTGTISPDIFTFPQLQGKQLRLNLQSTILTMLAGPYKEASFIFKSFQPPEPPKKRPAQADVPGESPTTKTRTGTGTGTATNNRIPRTPTTGTPNPSSLIDNIPGQPTPQGKTILKQIAGDPTTKLLHPGPIFPHPTRPNKFTLLCCRSAYEGKQCTYPTCSFFHFPHNLTNAVSDEIRNKMVSWVQSQASVEWTTEAATWANPTGN